MSGSHPAGGEHFDERSAEVVGEESVALCRL
jgi:hypothetical protein